MADPQTTATVPSPGQTWVNRSPTAPRCSIALANHGSSGVDMEKTTASASEVDVDGASPTMGGAVTAKGEVVDTPSWACWPLQAAPTTRASPASTHPVHRRRIAPFCPADLYECPHHPEHHHARNQGPDLTPSAVRDHAAQEETGQLGKPDSDVSLSIGE